MAIRHVVMWQLAGEAHEERRFVAESIAEGLRAMNGKIPGLLAVQAEVNSLDLEGNWDLILLADLQDEEALAAYQTHPVHVAIAQRIKASAVKRAAVDFEI